MGAGLKTVASLVVGTVGLFLLLRGKKTSDPAKMVWGGVLLVLSYWLFG